MSETKKGYVAAFLFATVIGFSFMFIKLALPFATPIDLLAHRFNAAFLAGTLVFLFVKKGQIGATFRELLYLLPLAILYPTSFFFFQTLGLVYTTSSEAGLINATMPIFTIILAGLILKERSSFRQKLFITMSVSGVAYIFIMQGQKEGGIELSMIGVFFILLSAFSSSLYNVFARRATQSYDVFTITYMMTTLGFIAFNTMAFVQHARFDSWEAYVAPLTEPTFLVAILFLGVLSSFGTSFLSNYALSKIEASRMGVFGNLATLITVVAGVVFLNESLQTYHWIGGFLILIGVVGTTMAPRFKNKKVSDA